MGVQGLWQLVSPVARPVQLETLRDRKLAIDASIWIHQFMRTMRTEDGSVLRNGHTLGFFRRICKLLFYNIKPVFVFDGGAPTLKRSTIRERRKRREGMRENIKRTAEKILKAQLKTQLLKEEGKRRKALKVTEDDQDENYVYLEQLDNTAALDNLRQQNAIKRDQYELPPLTQHKEMNQQTRKMMDPRLATDQELQDFIDEFKPSEIDMDSSVFQALPTEIQYEIIQDVKLKSRQTSWARLDNMVRQSKTPLDFSKQQILQLKHRNEMTQRVMEMNDMASKSGDTTAPSRIASERGKQYLLVKNENLEDGLGWKLPGTVTKTANTQHVDDDGMDTKTDLVNTNVDLVDTDTDLVDTDTDLVGTNADLMDANTDLDDPVARAVANDPKLAALMGHFGSEDDEDDTTMNYSNENHHEDTINVQHTGLDNYSLSDDPFDDDAPLFANNDQYQQSTNELDDRDTGNNDDTARNEILSKMYDNVVDSYSTSSQQHTYDSDSPSNPKEAVNDRNWELELDADDFYKLWESRVPDAFIYVHSFNNQYISILQNAISDTCSISELENQLKLVKKVFGKSNDNDSITRDAYLFHQSFLTSTLAWKQRLMHENSQLELYRQQHLDPMEKEKDSPLILTESDDDDDIQLMESVPNDSQQSVTSSQNTGMDLDTAFSGPDTIKGIDSHFLSATILPLDDEIPDSNDRKEGPGFDKGTEEAVIEGYFLGNKRGAPASTEEPPMAIADRQDVTEETHTDIMHRQDSTVEVFTDITDQQDATEESPSIMYSSGNESDGMDDSITDEPSRGITDQQGATEGLPTAMYSSGNESDGMGDTSTEKLATEIVNQEAGPLDFGYNSDEELTGTAVEENAEFARFVSDIASRDVGSVQQELAADVHTLNQQQVKQMGNADTITDQMIQDIQELLQLFGVPYVISPMEAEAQCAYLLEHDLVDGVVTDDSDVFLFGGSRIYKNMFSQQKYVECYLLQDIGREMHLDRIKLVQLAYFLGSDYTPGLSGIGYVSAMEILAAFEDDDDQSLEAPLLRFKQWYDSGIDNTDFEKKFRRKHKHLDIPPDFPNPLIKDAYFNPLVDSSLERFTWSPPQLDSLRLYLMKSFSWSEEKADEILVPVIREMNQRQMTGIQTTINSFFDPSAGLQPSRTGKIRKHKSARIQKVVKKLQSQAVEDSGDSSESDTQATVVKKPRRKRIS